MSCEILKYQNYIEKYIFRQEKNKVVGLLANKRKLTDLRVYNFKKVFYL